MEFGHLRDELDRLFSEFAPAKTSNGINSPFWTPAIDLREEDDVFQLTMDLPGMSAEDLDITFDDGLLTIAGERIVDLESTEGRFHRVERHAGRFSRTIRFNTNIQPDQVEADLQNGVLSLQIPKAETSKPYRISVGSTANQVHSGDGASAEPENNIEVTETA